MLVARSSTDGTGVCRRRRLCALPRPSARLIVDAACRKASRVDDLPSRPRQGNSSPLPRPDGKKPPPPPTGAPIGCQEEKRGKVGSGGFGRRRHLTEIVPGTTHPFMPGRNMGSLIGKQWWVGFRGTPAGRCAARGGCFWVIFSKYEDIRLVPRLLLSC